MPLIKSKSDKAFKKNVEKEMEAGKPQKQSLAIAFSVKKRAKKKMASGGIVKGAERDENLGTPKAKPDDHRLNEKDYMGNDWAGGPDPKAKEPNFASPAMSDYMAGKRKQLAKGGMINNAESMKDSEEDNEVLPGAKPDNERRNQSQYMSGEMPDQLAHGGEVPEDKQRSVDMKPAHQGLGEENDMISPSQKAAYHLEQAEKYQRMADGGMVNDLEDMDDAEEDNSPVDAIMSRRRKMADGGMVDLDANSEESTADHGLKYLTDANLKEQYDLDQLSDQPEDSNEMGDDREENEENIDDSDIVGSIRRKMKSKRS